MGYTVLASATAFSDATKVDKYVSSGKTANFTAAAGNVYLVDTTSGVVTATLPSANVAGQSLVIKRVAGTNVVTVNRAGSDTIGSAATTADLTLDNESWELVSSGTGQWNLTAGNKSLGSLDSRFAASQVPADRGYLAWTQPLWAISATTALPAAGTVNLRRIRRVPAGPVTSILVYLGAAGSGLTSGQCFAALYTAAGALIGQTADQATPWASGGLKTMALTGGPFTVAAGDLYIAAWFNGTTGPSLVRSGFANATLTNIGLASPNLEAATANASVTTTAPSSLGAQTVTTLEWWAALA